MKDFFLYLIFYYREWNKRIATKYADRTGSNEGILVSMWWFINVFSIILLLLKAIKISPSKLGSGFSNTIKIIVLYLLFSFIGSSFQKKYDNNIELQQSFTNLTEKEHKNRKKNIQIYFFFSIIILVVAISVYLQ